MAPVYANIKVRKAKKKKNIKNEKTRVQIVIVLPTRKLTQRRI